MGGGGGGGGGKPFAQNSLPQIVHISNHETILREPSLNCGVPHDHGTIIDPFPFHLNRCSTDLFNLMLVLSPRISADETNVTISVPTIPSTSSRNTDLQ